MYEQAAEAGISLLFLAPLYLASLRDNISEFFCFVFLECIKTNSVKKKKKKPAFSAEDVWSWPICLMECDVLMITSLRHSIRECKQQPFISIVLAVPTHGFAPLHLLTLSKSIQSTPFSNHKGAGL